MKFTIGLFTAAVGILGVAAHDGHDHDLILSGNIPDCAVNCFNDAFTKNTDCKAEEVVCMCKEDNFDAVKPLAVPCVVEKCGSDVALKEVLPSVTKLCVKALPDQFEDAVESIILEEIGAPATTAASNSVLVLAPSTIPAALATPVAENAAVATDRAFDFGDDSDSDDDEGSAAATPAASSAAGRVAASLLGFAAVVVAFL